MHGRDLVATPWTAIRGKPDIETQVRMQEQKRYCVGHCLLHAVPACTFSGYYKYGKDPEGTTLPGRRGSMSVGPPPPLVLGRDNSASYPCYFSESSSSTATSVSLLVSDMSKSAPADKTLEYLGVVERWSIRLKTGNSAVGQIADLGPQITQPRLLLQLQVHTVVVLTA
jgi:hypothetical protein